MEVVKLDPGTNLKLVIRKGRDQHLIIDVLDSDKQPFPITDEFAFGVKRDARDRDYLFLLKTTDDDEIEVDGNRFRIPFNDKRTDIDGAREYYYELINLTKKQNWIQGPLEVLIGNAPHYKTDPSSSLSISTGDRVVEVVVQGGGGDISQLTDEQLQQLASEISRATSFDYQLDFYIQ